MNIIEIVNKLLLEAEKGGASDIHLDPVKDFFRVRYRIDGVLKETILLPKEQGPPIISRLKVLTGLPTDEHQSSQDGRFSFQSPVERINVRISIVPTYYGENAVLRLLSRKHDEFGLSDMGFSKKDIDIIQTRIQRSFGMVLSTGPTGSGKTTTLYTLLGILNTVECSIVTIEDPIEYAMKGVRQIQVNHRTALTFANGLRAILRQDPDIIMVGEIRDRDTASIAINSALTGHLILSTLHTNDAASALPRLHDMGIDPYLVASTVSMIIGQRLIRRICPNCKDVRKIQMTEYESILATLPDNLKEEFSDPGKDKEIFYAKGCSHCQKSGFTKRLSLNEILTINEEMKELILRKASGSEIKNLAIKNGMVSMREDGLRKAFAGVTTISEVLRVINE